MAHQEEIDAALHHVSAAVLAVARHRTIREVLQVVVRSARSLLSARYAALGIPDEDGSFAEFLVDGISAEQWDAIGPLPRQHGLLAVMLEEGTVQRLADISEHPRFEGWPEAHPRLQDFLGVPIRDDDEVLGIIWVANRTTPGGFTERDEELLTLFAAHAAIAITNARLYENSRELSIAQERTRLARELHDAVAQKLFSLRLTAEAAAAAEDPAAIGGELRRVGELAAEALAELRGVIAELRPIDLASDGLAESLRRHVGVLDRAYPQRVIVHAPDQPVDVDAEAEDAIFRVAQEAAYNAVRHACSATVEVRLRGTDDAVVLEVMDDGVGFDVDADARRGLGLTSMRERARAVGASLEIVSAPGLGTTVRLTLPAG